MRISEELAASASSIKRCEEKREREKKRNNLFRGLSFSYIEIKIERSFARRLRENETCAFSPSRISSSKTFFSRRSARFSFLRFLPHMPLSSLVAHFCSNIRERRGGAVSADNFHTLHVERVSISVRSAFSGTERRDRRSRAVRKKKRIYVELSFP